MTTQKHLSHEELQQAVVDFFLKKTGNTIEQKQVDFKRWDPHAMQQAGTPAQFTATIYMGES